MTTAARDALPRWRWLARAKLATEIDMTEQALALVALAAMRTRRGM